MDKNLLIWHERMGHLSKSSLETLEKVSHGINLKQPYHENECVCEFCILGRMKHKPHNRPVKPGTKRCELVWFDVVGPLPIVAKGGERYFGHCMCDCTKWGAVKCFKNKSQAFEFFKEWQTKHEREGERIRRVRCDNGELASLRAFQDYCLTTGIQLEPTVPGNPAQ